MKGFTEKLIDKYYKEQREMREAGCSWLAVFNTTYIDEPTPSGAFVRLVEEENKTKITNAKQLQELTGIKEVSSYWNEKGKEIKIKTKKEREETAFIQIEHAFIQAMELRYEIALDNLLQNGAKYKDLLSLEPSEFNLPDSWETYDKEKNKETIIKDVIAFYFNLIESPLARPDLRTIAELLQAPYSVILEASIIYSL